MSDERYIGNESTVDGKICSLFVTVQSQIDLSKKSDECLHSRALFCINLFGGYASPRKHVVFSRLALNSYPYYVLHSVGQCYLVLFSAENWICDFYSCRKNPERILRQISPHRQRKASFSTRIFAL